MGECVTSSRSSEKLRCHVHVNVHLSLYMLILYVHVHVHVCAYMYMLTACTCTYRNSVDQCFVFKTNCSALTNCSFHVTLFFYSYNH